MLPFSSSTFESTTSSDSLASKKKHVNQCTSISYGTRSIDSMFVSSSTLGSTKSNDSLASEKKHEELSTINSYVYDKRSIDSMFVAFASFGSTTCNDSLASKKIQDKLSTIRSNGSTRSKQSKEERLTDAAAKSSSGTSDGVSVDDDAAAKSNSEIRDGAPVDDVSSENPTKLFAFVSKRNWAGVAERCSGADKAEATNWIVEHNNDGSIRWRLLPIHQVSSLRV